MAEITSPLSPFQIRSPHPTTPPHYSSSPLITTTISPPHHPPLTYQYPCMAPLPTALTYPPHHSTPPHRTTPLTPPLHLSPNSTPYDAPSLLPLTTPLTPPLTNPPYQSTYHSSSPLLPTLLQAQLGTKPDQNNRKNALSYVSKPLQDLSTTQNIIYNNFLHKKCWEKSTKIAHVLFLMSSTRFSRATQLSKISQFVFDIVFFIVLFKIITLYP